VLSRRQIIDFCLLLAHFDRAGLGITAISSFVHFAIFGNLWHG